LDETGQALVFRVEDQAVAHWGIAVEDLQLADPPVFFQIDAPRSAPEPWRRFLDRLSLAWVETVLTEYVLGEGGYHDNRESVLVRGDPRSPRCEGRRPPQPPMGWGRGR
jgi:hypothetical protein